MRYYKLKGEKMKRKIKKLESAEIITCGDTGTYGLTIWLGTKDKKEAKKRVKIICDRYNSGEKLEKKNRAKK